MTDPSSNPFESSSVATDAVPPTRPSPSKKLAIFCVVALVAGGIYWAFGDALTFENLASQEERLREIESESPWLVLTGAFCLYVIVSGLSIPGAAVALSLSYGSYFGWLRALVLVSFASTAGATVAFLLSRYFFRDLVQRNFHRQLTNINSKLDEEGGFYLFTLRLIPLVPFFMLNLVMGLTRMTTWSFWWISQLGMLAGTMAYIYAGSTLQVSDLAKNGFQGLGWEVAVAFAILGVFPLVAKKAVAAVKRKHVD